MDFKELIYDWNTNNQFKLIHGKNVNINDETLRDGLQSPSVKSPQLKDKVKLLHLMEKLHIEALSIGYPAVSSTISNDAIVLAKEIVDQKLNIKPNAAGRTLVRDVEPILKIVQEAGIPLEMYLFQGASAIRQFTENWDLKKMISTMQESIRFAVSEGQEVSYVTEDSIRSQPDTLKQLFIAAMDAGAKRLCLCDTIGHATPDGIKALHDFTRHLIDEHGYKNIKLDWHGHNDRGLALSNALYAVEVGYDRVHGTAMGIGERVGNTANDLLLVNMKMLGWIDWDLSALADYCHLATEILGVPIPDNYPVIGKDAFLTSTGVHASAVIKALKTGHHELANRVYSSVPAEEFGFEQKISIGPMSGKSNVIYWLETHGHEAHEDVVNMIFEHAKNATHILRDDEINRILKSI